MGALLAEQERFDEAQQTLERALATARDNYNAEQEMDLLLELGEVHVELEAPVAAARYFEAARVKAEEIEAPQGVAQAWLALGNVSRDTQELRTAAERYGRAGRLFGQVGDEEGIAVALHRLGGVLADLGEVDEAREQLAEAMRRYDDLGDDLGHAVVKQALARLDQE